jgi:hypothetical protein
LCDLSTASVILMGAIGAMPTARAGPDEEQETVGLIREEELREWVRI